MIMLKEYKNKDRQSKLQQRKVRKRERPRKRLRDEAEENLNKMEMKQAGNGQRPPGIE
jgi:hypothetical protein